MAGYIGIVPSSGGAGTQLTYTQQNITATAGQTTFTGLNYTVGLLDVYLNGTKLVVTTDYTAADGLTVDLVEAAEAGDVLSTISWASFTTSDTVSAADGGTFNGHVNFITASAATEENTTATGTVTLDFDTYQNFVLTLTGNVTLASPTTEKVGQSGFIVFVQDGTGGRTVSLGGDYETAGAAGITLSTAASATDIVPYVTMADGRILLGTPQLAFA